LRQNADEGTVSTPQTEVTQASHAEVVSPELVLIDPALAMRARERLADSDDALARLARGGRTSGYPTYANGCSSTLDHAATAAARTLSPTSLAAFVAESAAEHPGRLRRVLRLTAAVSVTLAVALYLVDVRSEPREAPATGETSVLREQPNGAAGSKTPGLRSSPAATEQPRTPPKPSALPFSSGLQRFAWAPTDGASGYHLELFHGTVRVFAADTARPQLMMPAMWTRGGRQYRLQNAEYRWYVWPILSGKRASRAIVQARVVFRDR